MEFRRKWTLCRKLVNSLSTGHLLDTPSDYLVVYLLYFLALT